MEDEKLDKIYKIYEFEKELKSCREKITHFNFLNLT